MSGQPLDLFIVVGEPSGDQLGFKLMRALKQKLGPDGVRFRGVGGERMAQEGLSSLFPLEDIAVMGVLPVLRRLPSLLRRIAQTAKAICDAPPDALIIIDSPDFTHRVARRVRRALPGLAVIDYVSPTVWAWRPGRARAMSAYVDHVLGLLPFEPAAHRRLGGPLCSYVGHPLIERLAELRPSPEEAVRRAQPPLVLLVLPGSRRGEIGRLMQPFGEAIGRVKEASDRPLDIVLPAVPHLAGKIEAAAAAWPIRPRIVIGEEEKLAAFRSAHAAIAASGTVTLELALSGVPMVVAYKVSKAEEQLKFLVKVPSFVLPNLVLGENTIPELLQADCTPEKLAGALLPLLGENPERAAQLASFRRLDALMSLGPETPSERAAALVLQTVAQKRAAGLSAG